MVNSNLSKPKLSVVLAVHNEEKHLSKCLDSVRGIADEIVVVDGNSTDKTVDLAKRYKAKVIETSNKSMFHINKQMAIDAALGNWILQLDADEVVDTNLCEFIKKIKYSNELKFNAYWIKRKNYFLGKFLTKGGQFPDPVIRLFVKGKAKLPQKSVHEQMEVEGRIGWAEGFLLHYNSPTFQRYVTNANRYTDLTAKDFISQNVKISLFNDFKYLLFKPFSTFFMIYFRHRGYMDGFPGLVFALFSGLHFAIAYMKLADIYRYETTD